MTKIVNCFFGKNRGGIEVVAKDYAEALHQSGYASEFITLQGRDYTDYLCKTGLPVHFLSTRTSLPALLEFMYQLHKSKADIVFLHGTRAVELGTSFWVRLFFPKIKFIGVSHGVTSSKYRRLKYLIVINNRLLRYYKKLGIPHLYKCSNKTAETKEFVHKTFHKPVVIGSSGRASYAKGFPFLIKAVAKCKKQGADIRLKIIGNDGSAYEDLVRKLHLEDVMEFPGWIEDKDSYYNSLDIYCSASTYEPFGLTIIEAMMRGLPVITTRCDGPKEIVKPAFGLMVPIENSKQLAQAIMQLIQHPAQSLEMGRKGREEALKNYNLNHLPALLEQILADVNKA